MTAVAVVDLSPSGATSLRLALVALLRDRLLRPEVPTPGSLRELRGIAAQVVYDVVIRPRDKAEHDAGWLARAVTVEVLTLVTDMAVTAVWMEGLTP